MNNKAMSKLSTKPSVGLGGTSSISALGNSKRLSWDTKRV